MTYSRPTLRLSMISCCRMGILSMVRDNSRTSQGAGLRKAVRPSLPINVSINARGRKAVRNALGFCGSVSVIMITSRSAISSIRSVSRSICSMNAGSSGLWAKTTRGLACQMKSDGVMSAASKIWVRSSVQESSTASADTAEAKLATRALIKMRFMTFNIGRLIANTNSRFADHYNFIALAVCAALPRPTFEGPHGNA